MTACSCPNCGSHDTQKLSVGYAQGMRVIEDRVSYSAWSRRCAPPEPNPIVPWWVLALALVSLFVLYPAAQPILEGEELMVVLRALRFRIALWLLGGLLLVVVVRLIANGWYLCTAFRIEYEQWRQSWICRRCGVRYIPRSD